MILKYTTKTFYFSLIALFLLALNGCKSFEFENDIEFINNDATYAIPLINTHIKLKDLFTGVDSLNELEILDDNEMILKYFGNLGRKHIDEIFANIPLIPYTAIDTFNTIELILGNNNLIIKEADLKAGTVSFGYNSEHDQDVSVEFQIPELVKDGQVFSYFLDSPYTGTSETVSILGIPLDGYKLTIEDNKMHMRYIAIKANGERDTVSNVNMLIDGLEFTYMEGYWGSDFFNVERDTIVIDVFDDLIGGNLYFTDPVVSVSVVNSFGFPVRSKVEIAQVISVDGDALPLESQFVDDGFDINYPTLDEVGDIVTTNFAFDKNNSNIDLIIGNSPKYFDYEFDGLANPDQDSTIIGFMTDSSFFEIKVAVELPLSGYAQDFALDKDFDVDFSSYDNVEWIELKVVTHNTIPFTVNGQMYFMDEDGTYIDSTFTQMQSIVEGADVNSEGYSESVKNNTLFVLLDKDKFNKVKDATKLRLSTLLMTSGALNVPVKFRDTDDLHFKVGLKLGLKN